MAFLSCRLFCHLLSAGLISLPFTFAAHAEDTVLPQVTVQAEPESEARYNLFSTRSASKTATALRDVVQTVNLVSSALLRDQAATSLQDALKNLPGVALASGDGQRDQVVLRGFSAISDQYIDGLRDDALYFRDLSNIERIDVLKGPSAVLYGRGSAGGLINRISKQPGGNHSRLLLRLGSWQDRQLEFDLARNRGAAAWRVTGAKRAADSFRDQQFLEREAIAPSLLLRLSPATDLLWQADFLQDRRVTDFGIPAFRGRPVDVDPGQYYGAANAREADFSHSRVYSSTLTLNHRVSRYASLRNVTRYAQHTLNRNNTLVGSVDEINQRASLNHSQVLRREHGVINQTEWEWASPDQTPGALRQRWLIGLELGRQHKDQVFRTQNRVAQVDLFAPVLPIVPVRVDAAPSTDNIGLFHSSALYLQNQLQWSPRWKGTLGVRLDRFAQKTRERRAGAANLARTDVASSPRAGVVFQPNLQQSLYLSWSESFQPSGENFALAANNAEIEPEITRNWELGARQEWFDGDLSLNAALFRARRTGIKSFDPSSSTLRPVGQQQSDGLELTLAGQLPGGWQIQAGYGWLDARITRSLAFDAGVPLQGKRATLAARHSASLWLARRQGNWRVAAGVLATGGRYANPSNTVRLPGYATLDAMLAHEPGKQWQWQLNLVNLLDQRYIVAGHGSSPNLNQPGSPRALSFTLNHRL